MELSDSCFVHLPCHSETYAKQMVPKGRNATNTVSRAGHLYRSRMIFRKSLSSAL